jgi:AraC-like DNA-binding protein
MDRRIELVIGRMESHLSKDWQTTTLAAEVNLSASRLRHLFKEETGKTPSQYLRDLRLEQAERLLRDTFLTVNVIAGQVGLSPANLIREFKSVHQCTPTEYRELLIAKAERSVDLG